MKKFLNIFKMDTIRKRLVLYSILLTMMMLITSLFIFYNSERFSKNMDSMFVSSRVLDSLYKDIEGINSDLISYLNTKNTDSYDSFYKKSDMLLSNIDRDSKKVSYDLNRLIFKDINNMIGSYLLEADEAIKARQVEDIFKYNSKYEKTQKILTYINFNIKRLNENQFNENTEKYFIMSKIVANLKVINIVILVVTIMLNIIVIIDFTSKISTPITTLAHAAEEISKGNFHIDDVSIKVLGEVKVMSEAFNKMKNNINSYILRLKEQTEIESRLMEEKMNNLKMKNLLKNAQISALQSQINPHFLFNTLNAGVQLAMIEDAEKTGLLLEKLSSIFRYNLSRMDQAVPLRDEVENFYRYIYILNIRFGDLIHFKVDIEEKALETLVPSMIIQPLIENACIHGVGDMEEGAEVTLKIFVEDGYSFIEVYDNGKGFDSEKITRILKTDSTAIDKNNIEANQVKREKGHTTGIGLRNVIKRVRLYYEDDNIVQIISKENKGTKIIFKIPRERDELNV